MIKILSQCHICILIDMTLKRQYQTTDNQLHKAIKPEQCVVGQRYAFSFNPLDQPKFVQFHKVTLTTYTDWQNGVRKHLSFKHAKVNVFMEISSKGRLHYHGFIIIQNIVKFYLHDLPRLRMEGSYEIDTISDLPIWHEYLVKQKSFMLPWCIQNELEYEIYQDGFADMPPGEARGPLGP